MIFGPFLTNGYLKISIRCVSGKYDMWGIFYPLITFTAKKGTRTSDYEPRELPPRFIRSSFLQKPYMLPGLNLQLLPRGLWRVVIHKDIISGPFKYTEKNRYLKISIECVFWEMIKEEEELAALYSLSIIIKSAITFRFESNEALSKFLQQLFLYEVSWYIKKKQQENK